jgi:Tol biopolymer transport system component
MLRSVFAILFSGVLAVPAAAQVTRASVSTAGVQGNNASWGPSISQTGRYVVFTSAATNLVAGDTNTLFDVFLRDRDTDADGILDEVGAVATTRLSIGDGGAEANGRSQDPQITPDGRYVVFSSTATNLLTGTAAAPPPAPDAGSQIYRLDRTNGTIVRVSETADGTAANGTSVTPVVSASGDVVVFLSNATNLAPAGSTSTSLFVREITADTTTRLAVPDVPAASFAFVGFTQPTISADGSRVAYRAIRFSDPLQPIDQFGAFVTDRLTGTVTPILSPSLGGSITSIQLTASGTSAIVSSGETTLRQVLASGAETPARTAPGIQGGMAPAGSPSGRYVLAGSGVLLDFELGTSTSLGLVPFDSDFSDGDRWLAVSSATTTVVAGDTNDTNDIFVLDLPDVLDADDDTLDDRWETLFSVTDPGADPDGDGQTNAQEEDAGTHPNGLVRRFLAEGATGAFFHTAIALANPDPALAATAVLTFDRGDGTQARRSIAIPAGRSAVVDVGAVSGFEAADVSTTVESDRFLGIERSMTWGSAAATPYGSHAETSTAAPSATWFLAEGSTVVGFDLFYLLQNPQATTTHTTVRFLLPTGTVITRTYDLAPGSRTTIYVNQVAGLEETDVSGDITADAPIVVERAMYRSAEGQPFALGHASMGVTAPATSWFLAEGATGSFFDLYVLIANPGATDATVQALYARPDGSTVTQTYTVRAHSRFSVYVDAVAGLENTPVATTLTSTNSVPIVAERAMYWPGGFFDYYEGHSSAGRTATALDWVVAAGETGGAATAQTFILIANTENRAGQATVTLLPDVASTAAPPPPAPFNLTLPPNSRTTVPITMDGRYGARVTSTGGSPVQLVVESSVYRSVGDVVWSAGSNALATPVP